MGTQHVIAARLPQSVMKIPLVQPASIAHAVVFLASEVAARVSGGTYDVTRAIARRVTLYKVTYAKRAFALHRLAEWKRRAA